MSLVEKKFQVFDIENNDYSEVSFVPAIVDGKEVYDVKNKIDVHCGYVTEAFLEALEKISDEEGKLNRNFVVKQTDEWGSDTNLLGRKIILDAPKSFNKLLIQTIGIVLRPTLYPEEIEKGKKPLTIITNGCFRILSPYVPLDIKVNGDIVETDSFSIVDVGGSGDRCATIDLDLVTNKVRDLNINGLNGESAFGGVYFRLKCTNKEIASDINIIDYTINGNKNDKSESGYIHFETAGDFIATNKGRIYMPTSYDVVDDDIEPCKIVTKKGGIYLMDSNINLEGKYDLSPISLITNGNIVFKKTDAVLTGENNINGSFRCEPTARQNTRNSLWMDSISSSSGIYLESKNSKECTFRLKESYFHGGEKSIRIRGESSLVGVTFDNSTHSKESVLENVNISYSTLKNSSNLKGAHISNSEVENFNLTNKSKMDKAFCFGFGAVRYTDINFFYQIDKSEVDSKIHSSLKNTDVSLWDNDQFLDKVGKGLHVANSNIQGNFWVETDYADKDETIPLNMNNSILTRGFLYIRRDPHNNDGPIHIANSEISGGVDATNLDLVDSSIIKGKKVTFKNVNTIKNAMIDGVSFNDGSVNSIDGGSYLATKEDAQLENIKKSKSTEDLELL